MNLDRMAKEHDVLKKALKKAKNKGGVRLALELADVDDALRNFLDAVGEVIRGYEAVAKEEADEEAVARMNYDLYHRRLLGLVDEIRPLARKKPDSPCNAYKLHQVNQVLRCLNPELEASFGVPLDIPDEDASLSYSDLAFLLRTCQDLSAAYARRRYRLNYEENGK